MSKSRRSLLRNALRNLRKFWQRQKHSRLETRRLDTRLSPRLEFLESRQMFNADPGYDPADSNVHIHAELAVVINGDQMVIPKGIGDNMPVAANNGKIHTHDMSGKVHIHPGAGRTTFVTLGEFFQNWRTDTVVGNANATLSDTSLFGNTNNGTHIVKMYVNGTLLDNNVEVLADYKIHDGDKLVLSYEPINSTNFPSFDPISGTVTVNAGAPLWLPLDGFDPNSGPLTYEVTSNNPSLVTPSVSTTNRALRVDVEGFGVMTFELFDNLAPDVVNRIVQLVEQGFYNKNSTQNPPYQITFHRVINNFVIQAGDPTGTGSGGSNLADFDDQFHIDLQHTSSGLLSMAKTTDDTNDSQFFVTDAPTRNLDFNHSIFGRLIDGEEVRDAINSVPTGAQDRPTTPVVINSITLVNRDTENAALMLKAPQGAAPGSTTVTVKVKDAQNNEFTQTFNVNVVADSENNAPFLNTIAPVSGSTGQPVNFTVTSTDVEGDAVGYRATKVGNGNFTVSVNKTTGQVTVTPGSGFTGTAPVNVQAFRLGVESDISTLAATLGISNPTVAIVQQQLQTETNQARRDQLLDLGEFLVERDNTFDQQLVNVAITNTGAAPTVDLAEVSDTGVSNTDNITNAASLDFVVSGVTSGSVVKLFRGSTLLVQGTATGTSITLQVTNPGTALGEGTSSITATQTPSGGSESSPSTALEVVYDTTAPAAFTSTAPTVAHVGFDLAYDAQNPGEGTEGFRYSLTGAPTGVSINQTTGVVTWIPTAAQAASGGAQTFTVVATDAAGNTTNQAVSLTVVQPVVELKLSITDTSGNPLTSLGIGQDFVLQITTRDLRALVGSNARGVFAAYLDVLFDSTKGVIIDPRTNTPLTSGSFNLTDSEWTAAQLDLIFGPGYANSETGIFTPGSIDELGAFNGSSPLGSDEAVLATIRMRATSSGTLTFSGNDADDSPAHDVVTYANTEPPSTETSVVTANQTRYTPVSITVSGNFNAVNDTFSATEDSTTNTFNPIANDASIGGATNTLTITAVGTRSNGGTVTITENGTRINYVPAANFVGTESFTYTVRNQNNEEHTATISVNVADANDPPVATNDTASVPKNSSGNVINVLANDNDGVDTGETLRVTVVGTGSAGGTLTIGTNGTNVLYTPAANFSGTESFTYTISDRATGGLTATATLTVSVSGLTANNDSFSFPEDTSNNVLTPLANDAPDPQVPNSVLTVTAVDTFSNGGSATITDNGTRISYTPAANFQGTESFTYTLSDGQGHTATATISVVVTNVNDPPTGVNDTVTAFKNAATTFDVLANDSSAPDPTEDLTIDTASLTQPTNGTVTVVENGKKISYTPLNNVVGATSFTYRVRDASGQLSAPVTVNVTVQDFVPGSLAGFAYFDVNNNGVRDAGEAPIAGVTITLTGTATSGSTTAVNQTVKTGDDGSYKFENVAPGNYTLAQSQPAFTIDGRETAGSQGGTTNTNDRIVINGFASGVNGTGNNFGERGRAASTISLRDFFSSTSRNYAVAAFDNAGAAMWSTTTGTGWEDTTGETFSLVNNKSQVRVQATNGQGPVFSQMSTSGKDVRLLGRSGNNSFYRIPAPPKLKFNPGSPGAAPTAVNDTFSTAPGTALNVTAANGVLKNDTDPENNTLTAAVVSSTTKGTLTLNQNGSFVYTPNSGFTGNDSFTYRASDGNNISGLATVTISVTTANGAPTGVADTFNGTEEQTLTVNAANGVLKNDTDPQGTALTASIVTNASKGTVTLAADGSFSYTPQANTFGTDSFTYRASDGPNTSALTTVTLTIAGVNDPPAVSNDTFFPKQNTPFTQASPGVLANDSDIDTASNLLTAEVVAGPGSGSLTLNPNGSFTYTPNTGFTGNDSFTYRAKDGSGGQTDGIVTLTVNPNTAPVAVTDNYTTAEDTALTTTTANGVLSNDTDVNNDTLTAAVVTSVAHGTLSMSANGTFVYVPAANYNGPDSFTYRAFDGTANSNLVTVAINVTAGNDAPTAVNDEFLTTPSVPLTVNAANGVLKNDTDPESTVGLTAVLVNSPASGTLSLSPDGSFTYTPLADFRGSVTFTYRAKDAGNPSLESAPATATIVVNSPPVANADTFTATEDTPLVVGTADRLLLNDTDADPGANLTAALVTGVPVASGTLSLNADSTFTYTPAANFTGTVSFTYIAKDGLSDSTPATVTITVNPVNDAPTGVVDTYTADFETQLVVNAADGVLDNDTDPETPTGLEALQVTGPAHGTLSLAADGSFTYTPDDDFFGADSFNYKARETASTALESAPVTVTINVNTTPVAVNDTAYTVAEEGTLTVPAAEGVLDNDTDQDGDTLTAEQVTGPASGTLTLAAGGGFTYTPNPNFSGTDSFTYRATDGDADSNLATVTITVTQTNDAPTAVADSYSIAPDGTLTVPAASGLVVNDTDPESDPLTAVDATQPANGTLTVQADGSFVYTPTAGFQGVDSFTYKARDAALSSASVAIVTITVNTPPATVADDYTGVEDTPLIVDLTNDVLQNDTDADGDTLTADVVTDPAHGDLTLNANGSFTYTPDANFHGTDSFTYRANDTFVDSALTTVTLTITSVDDAPVAAADSYTAAEDVALDVDVAEGVLDNDSDADNDPLAVEVEVGPAHGTLTLDTDGSFLYTPAANYNGPDSFSYKLNDGSETTVLATVSLTVTAANDVPEAVADTYIVDEEGTLTDDVLENDSHPDGGAVTVEVVDDAENGTLSLAADGTFTYTPNDNFSGTDSFTYHVIEGADTSNTATVTITVNDAPTAGADTFNFDTSVNPTLDVPATGVLANDDDIDDDSLTAINASTPENGTVVLQEDGSFIYTPDSGFVGTDSFTYEVSDGRLTTQAIVTITVTDGDGEGEGALMAALLSLMDDEEGANSHVDGDWQDGVDEAMSQLGS